MVTETDRQTEEFLRKKLEAKYPDHEWLGEETSFTEGGSNVTEKGRQIVAKERMWIVDPVDGTANFVHGIPLVAISIALAVKGDVVLGVIYNPFLGDVYTAAKGHGAFKNGKPIKVSKALSMREGMVVNNVPSNRDPALIDKLTNRINAWLKKNIRAIRNLGSAAMNMAYVASGCIEVYFEDGYGG